MGYQRLRIFGTCHQRLYAQRILGYTPTMGFKDRLKVITQKTLNASAGLFALIDNYTMWQIPYRFSAIVASITALPMPK